MRTRRGIWQLSFVHIIGGMQYQFCVWDSTKPWKMSATQLVALHQPLYKKHIEEQTTE